MAQLARAVLAAGVDAPRARHRQRVIIAAGHEHDGHARKHRPPQPRRPQLVLRIAAPQLAFASAAAGQDRAVLRHRRPVTLAGSHQDDGRVAMRPMPLSVDARWMALVLAAAESELSVAAPATGMHGAVLIQDERPVASKRCHRVGRRRRRGQLRARTSLSQSRFQEANSRTRRADGPERRSPAAAYPIASPRRPPRPPHPPPPPPNPAFLPSPPQNDPPPTQLVGFSRGSGVQCSHWATGVH